jgi:PAS domain S-box-containing protein
MSELNKEQLQRILDNFPDGIFTIDTELCITYVNPSFCELIQWESDDLIGQSITDHLGDLNILQSCSAEIEAKGKCLNQETIFLRKDGSHIHISKSVQMLTDSDGNPRENLVSIRDLTPLHRLNEDLTQAKTAEENRNRELQQILQDLRDTQAQLIEAEKMASLGGLVAGISHEINTPIGISITSASTLKEDVKTLTRKLAGGALKRSELDDFIGSANHACDILYQNLQRASELIRSFKQVAVDQSAEEERTFDLREYIDEILISIGPKFKHSKINIHNNCDADVMVHTNAGACYQVLSNLLLNSLTHGYEPADSGNIRIDARLSDGMALIDYHDDGKGISEAHIRHIFEPFFTTRRGQGGTGLGLSIIYNIVKGKLKGKITVDSQPGKGCHFHIRFPAQTTPSA